MAYIYDLSDTWNASGTTFFGIKMNVTNTASASGSKLLSLQVASAEYFGVDKSGNVRIGNGGDLAISSATGGDDTVLYNDAENFFVAVNGTTQLHVSSAGNFGVGNTSPGTKFDVTGNVRLSGANPVIELNTGGPQLYVPAAGTLAIASGGGIGSPIERVRVDSSGNVGIGTSSPSQKLHVSGAQLTVPTAGWTSGQVAYNYLGDTNNGISAANGGNTNVFGFNGITFSSTGYGGEKMRIDSSGNVGIGTTSPGATLDVGGGGFLQLSSGGTSRAKLQADASLTYLTAEGARALTFWTNSSERMRISSNGAIGIGGSGSDATLHIQQAYGGYDRLTQIAPNAASKNAFNLMAARNSSNVDLWWSWGVRNDNVWAIQQGVNYDLNSSTGFYFDSGGAAYKSGGGTWSATSDARVKTNIAPIADATSRIMALKPASFDYRAPEAHAGRVSDRGFIAQEFEEVYPHSVTESTTINDAEKALLPEGEALKSVSLNTDFFADLVAVVQELTARVAELEGK
jgi:hypothetical protein